MKCNRNPAYILLEKLKFDVLWEKIKSQDNYLQISTNIKSSTGQIIADYVFMFDFSSQGWPVYLRLTCTRSM